VLVDLGRAVHVLFYVRTDSGEPHAQIGRPKVAKTLPKAVPTGPLAPPLSALETDTQPRRRRDYFERDGAIILTALLPGCAPMS
jgi:hypothetical protein